MVLNGVMSGRERVAFVATAISTLSSTGMPSEECLLTVICLKMGID